jgi:hypothetical protein
MAGLAGTSRPTEPVTRFTNAAAFLVRAALVSFVVGAALVCAESARADESEAGTETHSYYATADTYVDARRRHAAYGFRKWLRVSFSRKKSYVRFNVNGLEGEVLAATLLIRTAGGARFDVRPVRRSNWRERGTTFANAPRMSRRSSRVSTRATPWGWTPVDVTGFVRGNGVVSLALYQRSRSRPFSIRSRETAGKPRLIVQSRTTGGDSAPRAPGPGGSTSALYRGRVGMAGATVWYEDDIQRAYLERMAQAGLTWIREDFHWGAYERQPGVWDWRIGDRLMRNASMTGVDVLGVIAYSAEWAASGPTAYHPPRDPNAYANFCAQLVARYGPGGSFWAANPNLAPRPLTAVEIWNEPWLHHFWRPNPDPAAYLRLVRAASAAIRAANPAVKILLSADVFQMRADTSQSVDWFRLLAEQDPQLLRTEVDAYSVHLYTEDRSPFDARTEQRWRFDRALITKDIADRAGASHPLWITEFGWTTDAGDGDPVSEAAQAAHTRDALRVAVEEWGGFVERSFLYYWGDPARDYTRGYSPLRPDGSPKPLWDALASLTRP